MWHITPEIEALFLEASFCDLTSVYLTVVFYGVRVGEEPPLSCLLCRDHEAGAGGRVLALALPRQAVVWLSVNTVHLHHCVHVAPLYCTPPPGFITVI